MRNHLHNTPISVGAISEETPGSSVRASSHFFTGRHSVLYSGPAQDFRRYICGVTTVVFYALTDNSLFYQEIAGGFIGRSIGDRRVTEKTKVRVIFSKWDAVSWRGSLVVRGSGLCVWIKVTRLSLFDGPQWLCDGYLKGLYIILSLDNRVGLVRRSFNFGLLAKCWIIYTSRTIFTSLRLPFPSRNPQP